MSFGSATSFALPNLLPRDDFFTTLSLWSAMCFAFSGFEIGSYVGQEVKHPTRTIPLGVTIAGALVTLIYIGGSTAVLAAIPSSALTERSGIADAVDLVSERVGLPGLGAITGILVALGALAGTNSWIAGAARVPFAAGIDRALPAMFARMHPRYHTPHVALLVQGLVATLIFLVSVFLTVTGTSSTVQEAYDIMVNLTILIYFVPYLYLFLALVRLRQLEGRAHERTTPNAFSVPGGLAHALDRRRVRVSGNGDIAGVAVHPAARHRARAELRAEYRAAGPRGAGHRLALLSSIVRTRGTDH